MSARRVLVCGHHSFAAGGLTELLRQAGHKVVCFTRGEYGQAAGVVKGPVRSMHANAHLAGAYDTVINYILLKGESIEQNLEYLSSLLRFCREHEVKHLIHISSVSAYKAEPRIVDEQAPIETDPTRKSAYGAIKAACDQYISSHLAAPTKLSLVRPGFVLGTGLQNPVGRMGLRLPWNRLLVVGNPKSQMPVVTRDLLNRAILRTVAVPPESDSEVLLAVDRRSPTREEYLRACCQLLGSSGGVSALPALFSVGIERYGDAVLRSLGSRLEVGVSLRSIFANYRFNPVRTEERLQMEFSSSWQAALRASIEGQERNFDLPPPPRELPRTRAQAINLIGFGRIVKQRHLPALQQLGFTGKVTAYDLEPRQDETGQQLRPVAGATLEAADLTIVASPGPSHLAALPLLRGADTPVLVEKPLCYSAPELEQWLEFARSHRGRVSVCHQYRFKRNVRSMLSFLRKLNPGKLHNVAVHFQSPPIRASAPQWCWDERATQTLLLDFSIHYLDLACMFGRGAWRPSAVRVERDGAGNTTTIDGRVEFDNYSVNFLLRQGLAPHKARLVYSFQNYSVSLGFAPDTFVAFLSDDNPFLHVGEAAAAARSSYLRVLEKVAGRRTSDTSHAFAFAEAMRGPADLESPLAVHRLADFYRLMFRLAEMVYAE